MKHTYTKKEVKKLFSINSDATFWRKQQAGIIPKADLGNYWTHTILAEKIPSLTTNP